MSNVTDINESNFRDSINSSPTVVVEFGATWCGPCKLMGPVLDKLSLERTDVSVFKVDVDECGDMAQKMGVRSIPVVVVYKNGEEKSRTVGMTPLEKLVKMIDN
jgi:thioredoxin 1